MANTPHELAEEFPEFVNKLRHMREVDGHFYRISNEYHEINRAIHRAETDIEPADDFHVEDMRKKRMLLKDEIYGMLVNHEMVDPIP
ncbi:YdcH family protein [Rhizobium sp. L1K21]|uniref:YdcH family protein n=1 Tax=Rhizobium sp. L1K21 TaxID=2954933 RepID=UPI002093E458|nr:YdcH family protein [Rhizobium sp. L1K21]MCO6185929.1 YdcH family protein [Rhizobium sp. L1K21]